MSTATANAPEQLKNDSASATEAFWDFVFNHINDHRVWEGLSKELKKLDPKKEGIPDRRIRFLKSPSFGVRTMSMDELMMFSRLLKKKPIDLVLKFNCGYSRLTRAELDAIVKEDGLVWDVVEHIA